MFLICFNDNGTNQVSIIENVPFDADVLHPVDFLHDIFHGYIFSVSIYTYVNELELQVIKKWLGIYMFKFIYLIGFTYILNIGVSTSASYPVFSSLLILVSGLYLLMFSIWNLYNEND